MELTAVQLVEAIYVPDDETCFAVLLAPSASAVKKVSDKFHLDYERVQPAVSVRYPTAGAPGRPNRQP